MKEKDSELSKRLKFLRKNADLEQTEVAERIGISYGSVQHHEAGNWPKRSFAKKYIDFYQCDEAWFMTGQGEPFPDKPDVAAYNFQKEGFGVAESQAEYNKNSQSFITTINRLLDKNDRQEETIKKLHEKIESLEAELEKYKEKDRDLPEKKVSSK